MRTECTFLYSNMHQLDPPYLQSQWPGWTHCRDWRTDSWPQLCGHPLHGWAWRCGSTACPNCARIYKSTSVERQFELNNNFCLSWVIIVCFVLKLLTSWVSGRRHRSKPWSRCQETSSTTAVWPVKIVLASTIFPSLGTVLMSHRQIVCKREQSWVRKCIKITKELIRN